MRNDEITSGRRESMSVLLARTTQIAHLALWLGVPAGIGIAAFRLRELHRPEHLLPAIVADGLLVGVTAAFVLFVAWCLVFALLERRLDREPSVRVTTAVLFGPPVVWGAQLVNRELLPGFLEAESLAGNAVMLVGVTVLAVALLRHLDHWRAHAWPTGRSRWPSTLFLGLVLLGAQLWSRVHHRRDPGPDIVVLLVDVLRADHLGCYGYDRPTSPHIDRLAQDSVLFENYIASSTFTKTSVASLFTGLDPYHHNVYVGSTRGGGGPVESDVLSERFPTLAEELHDLGLATMAWVENAQLRGYTGFDQGFTRYEDRAGSIDRIATEFGAWHERWSGRVRSFSYLHFIDLHGPYEPEPPYRGMFGSSAPLPYDELHAGGWLGLKRDVKRGNRTLTEEEVRELEAKHDEQLVFVDEWIGRILAELRRTGRYDDALIVLTSDHGDAFWEHGFISHSNTPFEELVRVPLIVKMPAPRGAGRRVEDVVGMVDLAPTMIELAGGTPPGSMDGESFAPLLSDPDATLDPRRRVIEYRLTVALRTDRWKYIDRPFAPPELYDLSVDPAELHDVYREHQDVARRFGPIVRKIFTAKERARSERVVVDAETREQLEALGYL